MDLSPHFSAHLRDLVESVGAGDDALNHSLEALVVDLRTAVSSYLGLRLTLVLDDGWPVTLTFFSSVDGVRPVTSLRVAVSQLSGLVDADSQIVFYAGAPGAFVDLAADLDYLHRQGQSRDPSGDGPPAVVLDIDLPPVTLVSGFSGLAEYMTINRALGVLIGRGQLRGQARDVLHRDAAANGLQIHLYAARLLGEVTSGR